MPYGRNILTNTRAYARARDGVRISSVKLEVIDMDKKSRKPTVTTSNFGTSEKRRMLRQHYEEFNAWYARREVFIRQPGKFWMDFPEPMPPFPEELRGMLCGAKNRKGLPCKIGNLFSNGRCKFHGGASTGPKTKRGKRRSAKNGFRKGMKRTPRTVKKT